jgi:hypothetical protein
MLLQFPYFISFFRLLPQELANLTSTSECYIREWLANQAAGGYLTYDSSSQRDTLPFEHAQALVNENSPAAYCWWFSKNVTQ